MRRFRRFPFRAGTRASWAALLIAGVLAFPLRASEPVSGAQTFYQGGAPHTDRQGRARLKFDPAASFFPIGIYHALTGIFHRRIFDFATFRAAGFNTVFAWEGQKLDDVAPAARQNGLQVIHRFPSDAEIRRWRDSGTILAWYLDEEPTLRADEDDWRSALALFKNRRDEIQALDPGRAVFVLDVPYIDKEWRERWLAWNGAGDISAHWNYPIRGERRQSLTGARGIPETVSLAARRNGETKPVWLVVQAFASPLKNWRLPSEAELRAMVYAGIVHGATGILYFAYDSFVTRRGEVVGVSPQTPERYTADPGSEELLWLPATAQQVRKSRALWSAIAALNAELAALAPAILSPTSHREYRVEAEAPGAPIRTLLKESPAGEILIAVNSLNAPVAARIAFSRPVRVRHDATGAPMADVPAQISTRERFAPFEVKIFRIAD